MRTTTTTSSRRVARGVATGAAALCALSLTGCGGSSSSAASGASAGVAATSSASGTASPSGATPAAGSSPVATPDATRLAQRITAAAVAKGTAKATGTTGGGAATSTAFVHYRPSGGDFAVTTTVSGRTVKIVLIGGAAYLNVGEKYQGKDWLRLGSGGADPLSKAFGPLLQQVSKSLDLRSQIAAAQGTKVTSAERTTLDGVAATKYTVVSTPEAFMAQLDKFAPTPELRKQLHAKFKGARSEAVMWVGDDDLPLRVDSRIIGGTTPSPATSVTYSDWGKPVTIAAPPAADVVALGR